MPTNWSTCVIDKLSASICLSLPVRLLPANIAKETCFARGRRRLCFACRACAVSPWGPVERTSASSPAVAYPGEHLGASTSARAPRREQHGRREQHVRRSVRPGRLLGSGSLSSSPGASPGRCVQADSPGAGRPPGSPRRRACSAGPVERTRGEHLGASTSAGAPCVQAGSSGRRAARQAPRRSHLGWHLGASSTASSGRCVQAGPSGRQAARQSHLGEHFGASSTASPGRCVHIMSTTLDTVTDFAGLDW